MTNAPAPRNHNNPPDPLDEALAPHGDVIAEAEGWLDGEPISTDDQLAAIDVLLKGVKAAEKDVTLAQKSESAPLHDAWKAALDRYKPTLTDLDRMKKGLIALGEPHRKAKAEAQRQAERAAWEAAQKAKADAEAKALAAEATSIDAQREAEAAKQAAIDAEKAAQAAKRDRVKGLRKVVRYEITDHRALLNWIATHHRDDITQFIEDWAARNHKTDAGRAASGMSVWDDKQGF